MKKIAALLALGACMSAIVAHAEREKLTEVYWKKVFVHASDEYFDQVYFPYQPTQGTSAGYHQYDAKLEDFSVATVNAEIAALEKFENRFQQMRTKASFDQATRGDCDMVLVTSDPLFLPCRLSALGRRIRISIRQS